MPEEVKLENKKETAKDDHKIAAGDNEDPWKIHHHSNNEIKMAELNSQYQKCKQDDRYENDDDRNHYEQSSQLMLQAIKMKH